MTIDTIDLHDAEKKLAQLIKEVNHSGKPIVIADDGKFLAQITPIANKSPKRIWGFMKGKMIVPDNFDEMEAQTIEAMFSGEDDEDSL